VIIPQQEFEVGIESLNANLFQSEQKVVEDISCGGVGEIAYGGVGLEYVLFHEGLFGFEEGYGVGGGYGW